MDFFAILTWDVGPDIVSIGKITVRWYGLLFALGFIVGYFIVRRMFRREGKPERDLETLLTYFVVSAVIGARLGHCLFYDPDFYLSNPLEILKIWKGGLASHGGTIALLIGIWIYCRSRPAQPYVWLLDRVVVPIALAASLIRLGNLFNSEIVGKPSDLPWAVEFVRRRDSIGIGRHPAQMYESLSYFLLFWVLLFLYRRWGARTPRGLLVGIFLVAVFGARFAIEYVKVRQAAWGGDMSLSVGQLLSIPMVALGIYFIARSRRVSPAPEAPEDPAVS